MIAKVSNSHYRYYLEGFLETPTRQRVSHSTYLFIITSLVTIRGMTVAIKGIGMSHRINSLKIKAKLLQKTKRKAGKDIKLKEAFEILARTAGYQSWRELKADIERSESLPFAKNGPQLRQWFSDHQEAIVFAKENQGYVVAYEKDYFIADEDFLSSHGIAMDDPDLKLIGLDWSQPKSTLAFNRLMERIRSYQNK